MRIVILSDRCVFTVNMGSDDEQPPFRKKASDRQKHRQQKFWSDWLADINFKQWLEADNNPLKTRCRVCNMTMTAELGVLKLHNKGIKHQKMLKTVVSNQPKITSLGFSKKTHQMMKKL